MVNHPNRSKQQQPKLSDMTGYEPDNVMIVEREEAAAVKMRVEGYEALKALNAELLAALKRLERTASEIADYLREIGHSSSNLEISRDVASAAIAKAEGR